MVRILAIVTSFLKPLIVILIGQTLYYGIKFIRNNWHPIIELLLKQYVHVITVSRRVLYTDNKFLYCMWGYFGTVSLFFLQLFLW